MIFSIFRGRKRVGVYKNGELQTGDSDLSNLVKTWEQEGGIPVTVGGEKDGTLWDRTERIPLSNVGVLQTSLECEGYEVRPITGFDVVKQGVGPTASVVHVDKPLGSEEEEKVWRVTWADGRARVYFENEKGARKFYRENEGNEIKLVVRPAGVRVRKANPCHDAKGRFCEGGAAARGGPIPELSKEKSAAIQRIEKKLGATYAGRPGDYGEVGIDARLKDDPDLFDIATRGKKFSTTGVTKMLGKDQECHWNAANLFRSGKVDAIATGYVINTRGDFWGQHSWGMKGGKIVETTNLNVGAKGYFGVVLSKTESKAFAQWAKENPPGW